MSPEIREAAIKQMVEALSAQLDEAASIARAAVTCLNAGNSAQAVKILLDIEQHVYEANTLLNAASLINRYGSESN